MDEPGDLCLKRRLRCGLGGRLLEWHPRTSSLEEWEKRDASKMQDESESHVPPSCLSRAAHIPIDQ